MVLPKWLDDYIFDNLGAKYCCSCSDMTVIDWDKSDILNYLGTYFPRSYAESYSIFLNFFSKYPKYFSEKEELSIFDFGCGTGGEIIGLINILHEKFPNIQKINITALDGNQHALRLYENVITQMKNITDIEINNRIAPIVIDDFYDMNILDGIINSKYNIIISFKAICEFVTKEQFEERNPYEHIVKTFLPKLENNGLMLLVDVTSRNNVSQEWLPKMMDNGLCSVKKSIIEQNEGYNQTYTITHSHKQNDKSKVAWRMLKK